MRRLLVVVMLLLVLVSGCTCRPKATPTPGPSPSATAALTSTPTAALMPTPGTATASPVPTPTLAYIYTMQPPGPGQYLTPPPGARIAAYFPVGPGRDLILQWCGTCHNVARVLLTRKDAAGWATYMENRLADLRFLPDRDVKTIQDYLVANFTPDKPTPQLPPELTR